MNPGGNCCARGRACSAFRDEPNLDLSWIRWLPNYMRLGSQDAHAPTTFYEGDEADVIVKVFVLEDKPSEIFTGCRRPI
jgi:hypothetical protein